MLRHLKPRIVAAPQRSFGKAAPQDVLPPFKRHRTPTTVLEALSRATGASMIEGIISRDTFAISRSPFAIDKTQEMHSKGKNAAQFVIKRNPNLFANFNFEEPKVNALRPTYSPENVGEPSEEALNRLIATMEVKAAGEMFTKLGEVSLATRLRLLDLMAATNGYKVSAALNRSRWKPNGPAELLFEGFTEEEKTAGAFQSMIRGAAEFGSMSRALYFYQQMRSREWVPDRPTFLALFRAARSVSNLDPWRFILELYGDFLRAGYTPCVESFNAMLSTFTSSMDSLPDEQLVRCFESILMEMEANHLRPNVGTLNQLLPLSQLFSKKSENGSDSLSIWYAKTTEKVLDHLLESPVRLEFGHLSDVTFASEISDAIKTSANVEIVKKFAQLVIRSPNLLITRDKVSKAVCAIFHRLDRLEPESAVAFYKERIAYYNDVVSIVKWQAIRCFIHHEPGSLDVIFNDLVRSEILAKGVWKYPEVMKTLAVNYSRTQKVMFRSVKFLWDLVKNRRTQRVPPLDSACALLAVCFPDQFCNDRLAERTALAWDIFTSTEMPTLSDESRISGVYHVLLLATNLVRLGRPEDASFILNCLTNAKLEESIDSLKKMPPLMNQLLKSRALQEQMGKYPGLSEKAKLLITPASGIQRMQKSRTDVIVMEKINIHLRYFKDEEQTETKKKRKDFGRMDRRNAFTLFTESNDRSSKEHQNSGQFTETLKGGASEERKPLSLKDSLDELSDRHRDSSSDSSDSSDSD